MKILALAHLTVLEAVRKKIFLVLLLLLVTLVCSAVFLPVVKPEDRIKLIDSVALGWTTFFGMLIAVFLSAFGIPEEIEDRRAFTILTKPVRAYQFVLGKWLGYVVLVGAITTASWMLCHATVWLSGAASGLAPSLFEARELATPETFEVPAVGLPSPSDRRARTPDQEKIYNATQERTNMRILDEWHPTATWKIEGLDPDRIPAGDSIGRIRIRLTKSLPTHVEVVRVRLRFIHPESGRQTTQELMFHTFGGRHRQDVELHCPRRFIDSSGRLEIALDRLDRHFYLLVQKGDVGIYVDSEAHAWNLGKSFSALFLMLLLVISFTVASSTILSGPVSTLAGITAFILGNSVSLIRSLARQIRQGEMTLEVAFRQLLEGAEHDHHHEAGEHAEDASSALANLLDRFADLVPDLTQFSLTDQVTGGLSISSDRLIDLLGTTIIYSTVALLFGVFCFAWTDIERGEGPWHRLAKSLHSRLRKETP